MKKNSISTLLFCLTFCLFFLFISCQIQKNTSQQDTRNEQLEQKQPFQLRFIGEQIIPLDETFGENDEKMTVGGLSGIDYDRGNNVYYLLCDDLFDENGLLRFYTAKLNCTKEKFESINITSVNFLKQENGKFYPKKREGIKIADPESIRFSSNSNTLFWSSEGDRERAIFPFIAEMDTNGNQIRKLTLPQHLIDTTENKGWYHNVSIEALALSGNQEKIWFLSETPLQQDGEMTNKTTGVFPIRLMCLDRKTSEFEKEFIYLANPVAKEPIPKNAFGFNGIVEILEWKTDESSGNTQLLVLERSYSAGYKEGKGTTVKLFSVETKNATDSKDIESLKKLTPNKDYIPLKKTLIANLSEMNIKDIDNIEGMTFGKPLNNGNKTIVFVSDNNFQAIQKTQFLVFEIIE